MASKRPGPSSSDEIVVKRKRTALTLETKLQIINRSEAGEGFYHLGWGKMGLGM